MEPDTKAKAAVLMTTMVVPALDKTPWPSLGKLVCQFIESYLVFGPGDLRGEPARLDAEKRALLYRAYEVYPKGHPQAGRRRFKRVAISLRKGSAKTEFAAWIVAAELHPDGPVRCDGFDAYGEPVGRGVTDPYIPMIAYTESQTEELAYGALKVILENSLLAGDFDIGLERIMRIRGDGKAEALASSPNANDGARTTMQHFDESHRFVLPRLKKAHQTMQANIPKRYHADAWSLETTTAFAPGENSIAEAAMDYAKQIEAGKIKESTFFFFHRQASEDINIYHEDGSLDIAAVKEAVIEASGPVAVWSDIDGIVDQFKDPSSDQPYLIRVWLNRPVRTSDKAFDLEKWRKLANLEYTVSDGALIVLGFDGSEKSSHPNRQADSTALIGTEVKTGFQWPIGIWEHPYGQPTWECPVAEVKDAVAGAFARWQVWRMYADPPRWRDEISAWVGQHGDDKVMEWYTNRQRPMHAALLNFKTAVEMGELSHDGNKTLAAHVGNCCRRNYNLKDEKGEPIWGIYKDRPDSPHKIDAAVAGVLSWEARRDAIAAGMLESQESIYETRGLVDLWAEDEDETPDLEKAAYIEQT